MIVIETLSWEKANEDGYLISDAVTTPIERCEER